MEGVHSGMASGIVPSSMQVLRILLDRIDDPINACPSAAAMEYLGVNIPEHRVKEAHDVADDLDRAVRICMFIFVHDNGIISWSKTNITK